MSAVVTYIKNDNSPFFSLEGSSGNEIFLAMDIITRRSDIPVELRIIIKQYLYATIESNDELQRYAHLYFIGRMGTENTVQKVYAELLCGPIEYLDTSRVTDMSDLFRECYTIFNYDLSRWNVSNVTTMDKMFEDIFFHPGDCGFGQWNVSKVKSMKAMFKNSKRMSSTIGAWDTRSLENAEEMFCKARFFTQSLANWNTGRLRNAKAMFKEIGVDMDWDWAIEQWDMRNVQDMSSMFEQCAKFNRPIGCWNISKVTNLKMMFAGASIFNQELNDLDTSSVIMMESMFEDALSFNKPLNRWNVRKVVDFDYMFRRAASFNQPLNDWKIVGQPGMRYMFDKCISLDQDFNEWFQDANSNQLRANDMFLCCPKMSVRSVRKWYWLRAWAADRSFLKSLGFLSLDGWTEEERRRKRPRVEEPQGLVIDLTGDD